MQQLDGWMDTRPLPARLGARLLDIMRIEMLDPAAESGGEHFCELIEDILLDAVASTSASDDGGIALRASAYPRIVRSARAAMQEVLGEGASSSIETICDSIGCSRRALQYAFQAVLGISPLTYFRALRLMAVRRAIVSGRRGDGNVHDIASRYGFSHLPRFARYYAQMFGELPSQSLPRLRAATGAPSAFSRWN